jgi:hypothetical protein
LIKNGCEAAYALPLQGRVTALGGRVT